MSTQSARSPSSPPPLTLPALRPMARAARVTLFEREVRERLSGAAIDILLGAARVLSEGRVDEGSPALAGRAAGASAWFGSTMLTIDLAGLASDVRENCDEAAAQRLAALAASDVRLLRRVRAIAEREAVRIAGRRFASTTTEVRIRAQGATLYVDVDVEGALVPALRLMRGGGAR